jgi:uroporphyrinogen-III synthase
VTAAVQVQHLFQIADEMGLRDELVRAFSDVVVCSIGPVTSAALRRRDISVDQEPTHPQNGLFGERSRRELFRFTRKQTSRAGLG